MKTKKKRQRTEKRRGTGDLPNCVLLQIMEFMNTKYSVQTCVLFRFQRDNLCGRGYFITNLCLGFCLVEMVPSPFLILISLGRWFAGAPNLLNKQNTQRLAIDADYIPDCFFPLIFCCQFLTFLKLSIYSHLPKSLQFPALKSLHLVNVGFTAIDRSCAEPFSTCNSLNTFLSAGCKSPLHIYANLHSLTLVNATRYFAHGIVLSTPNLRSLTDMSSYLPTLCMQSFFPQTTLISLLYVLADYDLSSSDLVTTQIPCYVQLKSLKLKTKSSSNISDEGVNRIIEFLLEKSLVAKVDAINC
ncbi:hypothetical protein GmHk_02G004810 [Glycine max]|nr:hypothetical protein GmHk_02G004810 [Glycine max]